MDVLGRYRNLIVLVGVLFAQVLGLAVQVKRTTDSEPTRLIRIWAAGAASAGAASLQETVHPAAEGGAVIGLGRQREIAAVLHRQGRAGWPQPRHGRHPRRWDRR